MQRLSRVGSSPNRVIQGEVDGSVLDQSALLGFAVPVESRRPDGPGSIIQVDEVRLRQLVTGSLDVDEDAHTAVGDVRGAADTLEQRQAPHDSNEAWDTAELDHREPVPTSAGARRLKRAFDVVGSLALLAATSPVMAACAAIVRRGSRGPIFFRQKRVGQNGRVFTILKFRTMYVDADPAVHEAYVKQYINGGADACVTDGTNVFKLVGDRRITPAGHWLRRLSLDELPQLFNVLRGDMSLVGPRPPLPYEVGQYRPRDLQRLRACPGITGLWQVSGRNKTTFDQMIDLDVQYIRQWSIWLDLWILWRTIPVVLLPDGH